METQGIKKGAVIGFFYLGRPTKLYTIDEVTPKYVTDNTGHKYKNQIGPKGELEDFQPALANSSGKAVLLTEQGGADFQREVDRLKLQSEVFDRLRQVAAIESRNFSEDRLMKIMNYLDVVIKTANEAPKSEKAA